MLMESTVQRPDENRRRGFLARLLMLSGLGSVAAAVAAMAGRYIYPLKGVRLKRSIFLAPLADIAPGQGKLYGLPGGGTALVTDTGTEMVALSDICPHLGCKVHYDSAQGNFICPCHGGVFEKDGRAIAGPPAEEGKNLRRYPLLRVGDNLFIEIEETVQL